MANATKTDYVTVLFLNCIEDAAVASEMRSLFGPATPSSSRLPQGESFATRAERLCGRLLSGTVTQGSSQRRRKRPVMTPAPRVKEWTRNVVLIDYQGQTEDETLVLYDYLDE